MNRFQLGISLAALAFLLCSCAALDFGDPAAEAQGPVTGKDVLNGKNSGLAAAAVVATGPELGKAATLPKAPPEPAFSPAATITKGEQLLSEGSDLYEKGDFRAAIRKLAAARDSFADTSAEMQTSLKYLAFSYCVTGQRSLCKAQFAALLKIAPDFQLSRAEAGHPQWGPVFKETRAGSKASTTAAAASVK